MTVDKRIVLTILVLAVLVFSVCSATAQSVVGNTAAPPETLDLLMHALPKGGLLGFSLNDHALADYKFTCRLTDWVDMGAARLLFREHGPHLPGINLNSDVYVLEKA